jgi:predicted AAA+ superfamily ATPase
MQKSIIITGPQQSGKTTLANSISNLFQPDERIHLLKSITLGAFKPSINTRVMVIDEVSDHLDIVALDNYIRGLHSGLKSFVGGIYITQDVAGVTQNKAELLERFMIFNMTEREKFFSFR